MAMDGASPNTSGTVRKVRRITFLGMAVNVLLAAAKAVAGCWFSSQALVADALHSFSDLATDVAIVFGVKYWEAPPDEGHPYGHGKIQALVTLFIALALLVVACELGENAVAVLRAGRGGRPGAVSLAVALVSIAVKEGLYRLTVRMARRVKSPALAANAWHHRSDALSSIPVAAAVALAAFFPSLWWADAAGALVVAGFILLLVWEIARPALQELTDAVIDDKSSAVAAIARSVAGVRSIHRCRARRYGGAFQADLHVQVDAALSIAEAHRLGHRVADAIVAAGIDVVDVVIHVEPSRETAPRPAAPAANPARG
ncbi:MAG: cation diffusion facilitator family transporter [Kiritimatiellia bacterium]